MMAYEYSKRPDYSHAMQYSDMTALLGCSSDTVMRPLIGLPPCAITPTQAEETVSQYALSDPTAKEGEQAWFQFSKIIDLFPYLFNPVDTATSEGPQMFLAKWLEDFIVDNRYANWEPALQECVRYLRPLLPRFRHTLKPMSFVFEDATLRYLDATSRLWVHCDNHSLDELNFSYNTHFKTLSYMGGFLGDYLFSEVGKKDGHLAQQRLICCD